MKKPAKKPQKAPKERAVDAIAMGRRLAAARAVAGFKEAADLAHRLGVSPQTLSNWETGLAYIPPRFAPAIYRLTKIDANYLYLDDPSRLPKDVFDALFPTPR